jgi:hypothetical protein
VLAAMTSSTALPSRFALCSSRKPMRWVASSTSHHDANNQPALIASGNRNFVGVWTSRNQDGSLDGVYGQRFNAPAN